MKKSKTPSSLIMALRKNFVEEFSRLQSRIVTRGMKSSAQKGYWLSKSPYGYQRAEVDEHGKVMKRLARGESRSFKSHFVKIVPGNRKEVETVQNIFRWRSSGAGMATIANKLNTLKVPSPSGGLWTPSAVRTILSNPVYTGTLTWGRKKSGKFTRLENTWQDVNPSMRTHDKDKWIRVENAFEPIVDRKTFNDVQQNLRK